MDFKPTGIPDVIVIEPQVWEDERGFFFESYRKDVFGAHGISAEFVQDNVSRSGRNVLRGLHYQIERPQGKLVRVTAGAVFDVAVDLRRGSSTFAQWMGTEISAANRQMIWIPPGLAHGFYVLGDFADIAYKVTDYWAPRHEGTLIWNDRDVRIEWPIPPGLFPILSDKDAAGKSLREIRDDE